MHPSIKPLLLSATATGGVAASLTLVNQGLTTLTLLCSAILGVYGVAKLFTKNKK